MIQAISTQATVYEQQAAPPPAPKPQATPAGSQADSVQLSPQAKSAATGDVDHDGDSH